MSELRENKMGTKAMFPLIMSMSLPAMFSMLIQALYNVVDSVFVARFSQKALSAVSLAYPLQMIMISFCVGTAIGVNSLIARRLGARMKDEADSAATHGIVLAFATWLLFLVIGLLFSGRFIALFTADETILTYGRQYLSIVLCVSFGMMVSVMGEKILQSTGNMIIPMLSQLLGAVINIIFDPLLIFGLWIFPKMGVVGAAVATVFGQICSMTFLLVVLFAKKHEVKITFKGFRFRKNIVKDIYTVGFPAIIMQSIGSVMVSGINAIISMSGVSVALSETNINTFGAYFKLQSFVFMPVFGLNQGVSPIIGYNFGARNKKRMYAALSWGVLIALIIMSVGLLLFQIAPGWLLSLFDADQMMMTIGIPVLRIISISFVFAAVGIMFSSLFQATGYGLYSMIMSFSRQLVVLLPVAFLLSKIDLSVMWYAFPIAEAASLIVAAVFFSILRKKEFSKMN